MSQNCYYCDFDIPVPNLRCDTCLKHCCGQCLPNRPYVGFATTCNWCHDFPLIQKTAALHLEHLLSGTRMPFPLLWKNVTFTTVDELLDQPIRTLRNLAFNYLDITHWGPACCHAYLQKLHRLGLLR